MQLKLSVGDEMLKIDVQPSDTFQDISERLYSLGNIKVDLKQLRSTNNDKPFDMTTNVMEYFNKTPKVHATNVQQSKAAINTTEIQNSSSQLQCRLCGEAVVSLPYFLFDTPTADREVTLAEKVNTALPIHVTKMDVHPKQICGTCLGYVDKSYDFMRMVLAAQNTLENRVKKVEHMCHSRKEERCPMCNTGHLKSVNRKPSQQHVSTKKSGVTVQVPKPGMSNKWGGHKRNFTDDDELSQTEFYQDDEVVTGYWEPPKASSSVSSSVSSNYNSGSSRKYKKRIKTEDDQDWTIDEEYVQVSRRGRPKGTKNKPKIVSVIQKTCVLCDWTGSDLDMLAHTINIHCQPDLDYFPCPMCRTRHANEMELENHIEEHTSALRR